MISVVIPTYTQYEYLELCLQSLYRNTQISDFEVIVVIDNPDNHIYRSLLDKWSAQSNFRYISNQVNKGFAYSVNIGVLLAQSDNILLLNDDNYISNEWISNLSVLVDNLSTTVFSLNQVEPRPSMFTNFWIEDLGTTYDTFDVSLFDLFCSDKKGGIIYRNGWTFPILVSRRIFQSVGGFDTSYPGNHVSDLDFFTKLELNFVIPSRVMNTPVYHFGSMSFKTPEMMDRKRETEKQAHYYYQHKWGYFTQFHPDTNSFFPDELRQYIE